MIVANGCPKSGTHALARLLIGRGIERVPGLLKCKHKRARFQLKIKGTTKMVLEELKQFPDTHYIHGHVHADIDLSWATVLTIIRDPRNVLVSYVRWKERQQDPRGPSNVLEAMDNFARRPFPEVYRGFLRWQGRCEIIRYEDLDPTSLHQPAGWGTWTGNPSDWRNWWTERIERKWRRIGGPDLVAEAGYPEHDYPIPEHTAWENVVERLLLR